MRSMETLVQKYSWVAHLLFIAVAAILLASAVTKYVAIQLAPFTVPEVPKVAGSSPKASKTPSRKPIAKSLSRAIVQRCLFGCSDEPADASECPEECPEGQSCQAGKCVPIPAEQSALMGQSDLGVKLMGAMVAANPDYSIALFSDGGSKTTYILGIGEKLMNQADIVDIRRDRVIVRRNGKLEYIKLEDSLGGAPTLTSTVAGLPPGATDIKRTPVPPPLSKDGKEAGEAVKSKETPMSARVKEISDGVFQLDGEAVKAELNDTDKLARGAKVIPNYQDGQPAGIKLVGIRQSSVYAQLGIESGDVVSAINGTKVKSQAHAFELLQGLKGAKSASIEIERRGESRTLKYNVK